MNENHPSAVAAKLISPYTHHPFSILTVLCEKLTLDSKYVCLQYSPARRGEVDEHRDRSCLHSSNCNNTHLIRNTSVNRDEPALRYDGTVGVPDSACTRPSTERDVPPKACGGREDVEEYATH